MMKTHYELLGVTKQTTVEELRARFRDLARTHHPDAGGAEGFEAISEAYATLRHPKNRQQYDNELWMLRGVCLPCDGDGVIWRQRGFTARAHTTCPHCMGSGVGPAGKEGT